MPFNFLLRSARPSFVALAFAGGLAALGSGIASAAADTLSGAATVVDAGTLEIQGTKVRLHGIDAPNDDTPCLRDAKPWKCGEAAKAALRTHIEGKTVNCTAVAAPDGSNAGADCKVGDENLNALLVREGWAMDRPSESKGAYKDAQKEAKKARRGVWATDKDNPEEVRRQRTGKE
jgi:endonuclease YncB( thermonuclease family)